VKAVVGLKEVLVKVSVQRGGATQVEGSWRSLPGSHTSRAGRAKVPRKATNLALVVYDAAHSETALLVGTCSSACRPRPGIVGSRLCKRLESLF